MKYVCPICGYVYDEEKEGVSFKDLPDDWKCPICGAEKNAFDVKEEKVVVVKSEQKKEEPIETIEDYKKYSIGELASICSNLARGCEKQYLQEASNLYKELANYFDSISPMVQNANVEELQNRLNQDIQSYADLREIADENKDRGAARVCVWGEKVTRMLANLVGRYIRDGEKMLENTNIWICSICGFVYIGENAPELCPVCKVPAWKFEKVEGGTK